MTQHTPTSTAEKPKPSWRVTYLGADDNGAGRNVSWGAIFAGVATFVGLLVTFSLVGTAIGFGGSDLTSDDPLDGVGTGLAIWSVFSLIVAFAGAGFVSGVLAVRAGFMHGVVTWATSAIATVAAVALVGSAALGAVGSVVGGALNLAGDGAQTVASAAADAVDGVTDAAADAISDVDGEQVSDDVQQILTDTGVPDLQPEYLSGQLDDAGDDIAAAGRALLVDPQDYEAILTDLTGTLRDRVETIDAAADRDAIRSAVSANSELTPEEVDQIVDNAEVALDRASTEAERQLNQAETAIEEAQATVEQTVNDARAAAEDATNRAAAAAGWGFAGLLLGLAITAFAALAGSRLVVGRNEGGHLRPTART